MTCHIDVCLQDVGNVTRCKEVAVGNIVFNGQLPVALHIGVGERDFHLLVAVNKHTAAARCTKERDGNVGATDNLEVIRVGNIQVKALTSLVNAAKTLTATVNGIGLVHFTRQGNFTAC